MSQHAVLVQLDADFHYILNSVRELCLCEGVLLRQLAALDFLASASLFPTVFYEHGDPVIKIRKLHLVNWRRLYLPLYNQFLKRVSVGLLVTLA